MDLSYADLEGATLIHADLRDANLTGAHLAGADLRWADLRGAALQWADLRDAHIEGARLEGVDARFASIDARQAGDPALEGAVVGGFLDQDQIREIRRTFDLLAARGTRPVEHFYERLFELAPETRAMFRSDPRHQAAKFLHSLRVIVSALGAPRRHVEMLKGLGARHRGYGVEPSHYAPVTEAFLAAFAEALGPELTPEATAAWRRAFDLMATVMTGGGTAAAEPGPVDSTRSGAPGTNGEVGAAGEPAYRSAPTRTPA